jgi:tRNA modification GTPase
MGDPSSTIAAIATGLAPGGVGIIRISGRLAPAILRRVCPALPQSLESHRLYHCAVRRNDEVLDDVLAVLMRGPHSFTGEDVVEIHGHGGVVNMKRLLGAALSAGARVADPGEFTQRAFLNGRMDLTQAEAVIDVINARSEAALELAQADLAGRLGETIRGLREDVAVALTLTEAAIDFSTDEHVYQLDVTDLAQRLQGVLDNVAGLLGTYDAGRQTREGVRVVFVGRPNAGKSTLFNVLCGHDRAIVTEIPGTTRDYLEESLDLEGVPVHLVDTAGICEAMDEVERIGIGRTFAQAKDADLLVWVVDQSVPLNLGAQEETVLRGANVLAVLNKSDLPSVLGSQDHEKIEALACGEPVSSRPGDHRALQTVLAALARARVRMAGEGVVIARARHRQALQRAQDALVRGHDAALKGLSHEFVALDLRLGLDALGQIVGHVSVDDVLHRIFAEFCVGK